MLFLFSNITKIMKNRTLFPHYYWKLGDRSDGYRVTKIDTMFRMVPYFLRTRMDSQIFFEERVPIDEIESFIKKEKEAIPGLSIMHVVIASFLRVISQRPYLNRFVIWNKIFSRNEICFSIVIKRNLSDEGEETLIKPYFSPSDTLADVVNRIACEVEENKPVGKSNSVDVISKLLGYLPDFLMRIAVFALSWADKVGILPKSLVRVSPWHASVFLTNIGSIGIESVYHHLYEFGTCSLFLAMGKKSKDVCMTRDNELKSVRSIGLRFVVDERICDGFYYASSMRLFSKILASPEQLLLPPDKIILDEGVGKRRWKRKKKSPEQPKIEIGNSKNEMEL